MQDRRNHITLVLEEWLNQTSRLPKEAHEPYSYLMTEYEALAALARKTGDPALEVMAMRLATRLDRWLETSFSVEGWGAQLLADAMKEEDIANEAPASQIAILAHPVEKPPEKKRGLRGLLR